MKIKQITEAVRPEHVAILNRMRAAGDKDSTILANMIQAELQKSNVPFDVAAEIARNKKAQQDAGKGAGIGRGKYTTYRDGTDRKQSKDSDSTGSKVSGDQKTDPEDLRSKSQNKTKSFSSNKLDSLGARKAYFDLEDPNSIKNKVKKTWKDKVTSPINKYADDDDISLAKRTPVKIARTAGSAIKTAYNKAFKKPK